MTKISTRQTGRVLLNSTRPQRNGLATGKRASAKLYTATRVGALNLAGRSVWVYPVLVGWGEGWGYPVLVLAGKKWWMGEGEGYPLLVLAGGGGTHIPTPAPVDGQRKWKHYLHSYLDFRFQSEITVIVRISGASDRVVCQTKYAESISGTTGNIPVPSCTHPLLSVHVQSLKSRLYLKSHWIYGEHFHINMEIQHRVVYCIWSNARFIRIIFT